MTLETTTAPIPTVLVAGLFATPRFYAEQIPVLWQCGPIVIADHRRDDSLAAIAARVLANAPPRFALVGHSMGGYIAFEIMRQASERVTKLALLDTSARADTPEQTARRKAQIALTQQGRYGEIPDLQFPLLVHSRHQGDAPLRDCIRAMAHDTGPEAFVRQQTAIIGRPDSRPGLSAIGCKTLVVVGDGDQVTPPELATEIAENISGATLVTIPECGHICALEQPERVTDALLAWLHA